MDIREAIKKAPVLFDGAMGTYYVKKTGKSGVLCEAANLQEPEVIRYIHSEYIEAGADAICTNTFSANRFLVRDEKKTEDIISRGLEIANSAVAASGRDVMVFASIGPVPLVAEAEKTRDEYIWIADRFIKNGAKNFIFETMVCPDGLAETAAYIKAKVTEAFIIVNFAVQAGGYTTEGYFDGDILRELGRYPEIDLIGFNCGSSAGHMLENVSRLRRRGFLKDRGFAALPNAGYPVILGDKPFYQGDPVFFAERVMDMVSHGAVVIGGCCGTTPEHIRTLKQLLDEPRSFIDTEEEEIKAKGESSVQSHFWNSLSTGRKVIAVELDPVEDVDLTRFTSGVRELKEAGADIITIADCPIGRARMDSSLLACKVYREEGIEAIPHMTCRDRNINATKALMLGQYAEGLRNVLLVTGDPIPSGMKDEVKAVYQFNSRKLARFAASLNERVFPEPMHFFGALNLNVRNFDIQLKLAKEKEEAGICGFLTQPVLTEEAFENLKIARNELKGYILGGIIPIVSERNARFMDSEIGGINVDNRLFDLYAGKSREEAEDLAVEICSVIADRIRPYIDGFYLMTPFLRTGLMARIIAHINNN